MKNVPFEFRGYNFNAFVWGFCSCGAGVLMGSGHFILAFILFSVSIVNMILSNKNNFPAQEKSTDVSYGKDTEQIETESSEG